MVAANNAKLRMREPLDPEAVKAVFARDEYQCVYCSSTDQLSLDHLHPVSRGGCNEAWNLAVACKSCNSTKRDKTPAEFFWYQAKIREHERACSA